MNRASYKIAPRDVAIGGGWKLRVGRTRDAGDHAVAARRHGRRVSIHSRVVQRGRRPGVLHELRQKIVVHWALRKKAAGYEARVFHLVKSAQAPSQIALPIRRDRRRVGRWG